MNNNRYQWVDVAKGIGIILVVYGHTMRGLNNASLIDANIFWVSDTLLYSFHMPLFFLLSGLFFKKSIQKRGSGGIFIEKCKTILYPYMVWSLLQTMIEIVLSRYTNGHQELSSIYTCLFIPRAQFWFLFALFFINIINLLLYNHLHNKWLIVSFIIGALYYLFPLINLSVFSRTFQYLIFFNIGILISDIFLTGHLLRELSKWKFFILSILLFIISQYFYITKFLSKPIFSLIPALIGTLLVILIAWNFCKSRFLSKLFIPIGLCSMEIYLLHILVTAGIRISLNNIFNIHNSMIHITLGTLCGVLIPFIIVRLFKGQKWFHTLIRLP
jgi:fucose 4-O-acetylase-like acetyltransferase